MASPLRRHPSLEVSSMGAAAAARLALERIHVANHEFVLHFDVDVISNDEFPWTNFPGAGGLPVNEVRNALRVFVTHPNLAAFVVAGYNPDLESDGQGARKLIDLLTDVLSTRLESSSAATAGASDPASISSEPGAASSATITGTIPLSVGSDAEVDPTAPGELPDATEPDPTAS